MGVTVRVDHYGLGAGIGVDGEAGRTGHLRADDGDVEFLITTSDGTLLGNANGKYVTDRAGTILAPVRVGDTELCPLNGGLVRT